MFKKSGMTILELVVAIVIIAILAAVGFPNFISWRANSQLNSAASELHSTMQMARMSAIRVNANVAVLISPASKSYIAFVDDGDGGGTPDDWVQNGNEKTVKRKSITGAVDLYEASFDGGLPRIRFNKRGFPNGSGGHVYLKNENDKYKGVLVNITGNSTMITSNDGGATWE